MNPVQKKPHITELFACTRIMLAFIDFIPKNYLNSSGTCSTPKLSKQTISLLLQNKATQCLPTSAYLSRFITYAPSFIFSGMLSKKRSFYLLLGIHQGNGIGVCQMMKKKRQKKFF